MQSLANKFSQASQHAYVNNVSSQNMYPLYFYILQYV